MKRVSTSFVQPGHGYPTLIPPSPKVNDLPALRLPKPWSKPRRF